MKYDFNKTFMIMVGVNNGIGKKFFGCFCEGLYLFFFKVYYRCDMVQCLFNDRKVLHICGEFE